MATSAPFLIHGPQGEEFELNDVAAFAEQYKPQGYTIVSPAPTGYVVPELPKPEKAKAEPKADKVDEPKDKDA